MVQFKFYLKGRDVEDGNSNNTKTNSKKVGVSLNQSVTAHLGPIDADQLESSRSFERLVSDTPVKKLVSSHKPTTNLQPQQPTHSPQQPPNEIQLTQPPNSNKQSNFSLASLKAATAKIVNRPFSPRPVPQQPTKVTSHRQVLAPSARINNQTNIISNCTSDNSCNGFVSLKAEVQKVESNAQSGDLSLAENSLSTKEEVLQELKATFTVTTQQPKASTKSGKLRGSSKTRSWHNKAKPAKSTVQIPQRSSNDTPICPPEQNVPTQSPIKGILKPYQRNKHDYFNLFYGRNTQNKALKAQKKNNNNNNNDNNANAKSEKKAVSFGKQLHVVIHHYIQVDLGNSGGSTVEQSSINQNGNHIAASFKDDDGSSTSWLNTKIVDISSFIPQSIIDDEYLTKKYEKGMDEICPSLGNCNAILLPPDVEHTEILDIPIREESDLLHGISKCVNTSFTPSSSPSVSVACSNKTVASASQKAKARSQHSVGLLSVMVSHRCL